MQTLVLVIHVLLAITTVALVLLQQGKGADAGAAFGSGASGTVFGAGGPGNFLQRMTTLAATLFFVTSLTLAVMAAHRSDGESILDRAPSAETGAETQAGESDPAADPADQGDLPPIEE